MSRARKTVLGIWCAGWWRNLAGFERELLQDHGRCRSFWGKYPCVCECHVEAST